MSFRLKTTCFAMLFFVGGYLTAGCGGGDSPTSPPITQPPTPPAPPPAPTVSTIEISPNTASLEVGRTQGFVATAKASDGSVIGGVNFTWSSSNTAVVTINSAGVATAVSAGTATIRATGNGITSAPATITVTVAAVARVTIAPSSTQELVVGEMVTFTATARTAGGAIRGDVSISWASSDSSVVTITSAGVATAVGAGTATVRATADGIASSPVTINVAEPPPPEPVVSTVTVSPASMMLMVGGLFQFTAVAMTADGMVVDDAEFTWMSDDEEVATVDETGLVTAVAAGTAMITATAGDVTSMSATVTVAEAPPEIDSVEIVDAMPLMLEIGDTHQLMAVALTSEGTMIGGVAFAWSSDDNEVATVDSTGLIMAVAAGMADVTVMAGEVTSEAVTVTVSEPPPVVDRVTVTPSSTSIEEGDTRRFTATAYTADDAEIPGKTFTWSSSDETVATVGTNGLATGVSAGEATITATADDVSGTATLTVTEPPPPPPPPPEPMVATVTVLPSSATIEEGETRQFRATARTADGTSISDVSFSWSSSDEMVATISTSGLATAVNAGSTTITATADGVSGTATLRVTEPPPPPPPPPVVDRVTVSPSSPSIEVSETQQFSATAYESDDTEISGKTFTWSSSSTSVATINSSGLATAVSAGSTTIRATVDGVSGSTTLTVTAPPPPPPPMLKSRTGTISGRNNYRSGGSVTLSETSDGKLKLSITGLSLPGGAPDVYMALYTSADIDWPSGGSLPSGAEGFGEVTGQSGNWSHTFTPGENVDIDTYSHLILHCRLINREVGSASLSN